MHVWCEFLDPHLTTYRSNIGVQVVVFDVGICLPRMASGLPRDLCHPMSNSESCRLSFQVLEPKLRCKSYRKTK